MTAKKRLSAFTGAAEGAVRAGPAAAAGGGA
jgi:hypothetical protein